MKKCNMCGKELDFWDEQEGFSFHKTIGYGSEHDGETIKINLCCRCFDEIVAGVISKCTINPVVNDIAETYGENSLESQPFILEENNAN